MVPPAHGPGNAVSRSNGGGLPTWIRRVRLTGVSGFGDAVAAAGLLRPAEGVDPVATARQ
jgi:hypothetical protein